MEEWIQREIKFPKKYSVDEMENLAEDILDYIIKRTAKGKGTDGEKFPEYSESYKKSYDFKATGKSKKVDLRLSGEMLSNLEIISVSSDKIVYGYREDSDVAQRVEGNIRGTYGKQIPDGAVTAISRDFLTISEKELQRIAGKLSSFTKEEKKEIRDMANKSAIKISGGIGIDTEVIEDGIEER